MSRKVLGGCMRRVERPHMIDLPHGTEAGVRTNRLIRAGCLRGDRRHLGDSRSSFRDLYGC